MPIAQLRQDFQQLKLLRRLRPNQALDAVGRFGRDAVHLLSEHTEFHPFEFKAQGTKDYDIAARPGTRVSFSRAINRDLFIPDPDDYVNRWADLATAVRASAAVGALLPRSAKSLRPESTGDVPDGEYGRFPRHR